MAPPSKHPWFKSTYSGGSGTECVECADTGHDALIRDSKNPDGPVLTISNGAWLPFIRSVKHKTD